MVLKRLYFLKAKNEIMNLYVLMCVSAFDLIAEEPQDQT